MAHEDFRRALTRAYLQNPCQVLPNPLWQTLARLDECETAFASDTQGVNRLEAWTKDSLVLYWRCDDRQPSLLISRKLAYQSSAIMHQDFLDSPTVAGFKRWESRYRLIYRDMPVPPSETPEGFRLAGVVNSREEAQAVAAHIEQEGPLAQVQDWLQSPAFAPDLWWWLIDEASDQPAGIAIADLDAQLHEASLLWVQIFAPYQGRGLGRFMIHDLLRRIGGRALFTTVSGVVEDRDNPGAFFQRCGFSGSDVWWFLSRV
jgi:GNAT superfamily N-acetyltransferase